ncbi:MAG: MOSC domain-containing protein [Campylobacterota bacterium]|nr:MOSC domain-containing protein [Campylobacterota bacterium]
MQNRGSVLKLFISESGKSGRVEQSQLSLDANGVLNDKFYGKDVERSVLISSIDSYKLTMEHNIEMKYGDLGENIVVDFNPYALPANTPIKIGDAVLEIIQRCTLCKSLSKIDSRVPKLLKDDRGVFAKVIKAGTIDQESKVNY